MPHRVWMLTPQLRLWSSERPVSVSVTETRMVDHTHIGFNLQATRRLDFKPMVIREMPGEKRLPGRYKWSWELRESQVLQHTGISYITVCPDLITVVYSALAKCLQCHPVAITMIKTAGCGNKCWNPDRRSHSTYTVNQPHFRLPTDTWEGIHWAYRKINSSSHTSERQETALSYSRLYEATTSDKPCSLTTEFSKIQSAELIELSWVKYSKLGWVELHWVE